MCLPDLSFISQFLGLKVKDALKMKYDVYHAELLQQSKCVSQHLVAES